MAQGLSVTHTISLKVVDCCTTIQTRAQQLLRWATVWPQ